MNPNDWKKDDPAWLAQREALWQQLLPFLKDLSTGADRDPEEYMRQARAFFDGDQLVRETDYVKSLSWPYWDIRLALHPNPTREVILELFNGSSANDSSNREYAGFWSPVARLSPLFVQGVLSKELAVDIISVFYGNSYEEAIKLRGIDANENIQHRLREILTVSLGWSFFDNLSGMGGHHWPAKMLWAQAEGILPRADAEVVKAMEWALTRYCKNINHYPELPSSKIPEKYAFLKFVVERLRLLRPQLDPAFWPYVDSITIEL